MYVCLCRAVTDRCVRAAVEDGARDPAEVGGRCGAGTRCGGCLPALQAMLAELLGPAPDPTSGLPAGHAA